MPFKLKYSIDNTNCQIVSYENSGNYIYQMRLEDLGLSETLTRWMLATTNTLEYLYVEFVGVHTTEYNGQLMGMGFDFVYSTLIIG